MYNFLTHKTPYGAAYVGGAIDIKFPLDCGLQIKRVFIVLRQVFGEGGAADGGSLRFELPYRLTENGEDIFEGALSLLDYGIYKYRFEGEYGTARSRFSAEAATDAQCLAIGCPNGS